MKQRIGIAGATGHHERSAIARSLATGSVAGLITTAVLALRGRREAGSSVAPINATSHVFWGDEAGTIDAVDAKHTVPGLLINSGAGIFWALLHERFPRRGPAAAAASGAAVAGLAYVVDYHLIPRRLTPGWELRLSRKSVALGFAALGLSLAIAGLTRARR